MSRPRTIQGPPVPTPLQRCESLIEQGDVQGVWDIFLSADPSRREGASLLQCLQRVLERLARIDPGAFSDDLHAKMISFVAFFVFRAHYAISKVLAPKDGNNEHRGIMTQDDSEDLQRYLPHLLELQRHLIELEQSRASVRRLNALTREKELANAKKERLQRTRAHIKRVVPAIPLPSNGEPVNRLAGSTDQSGLN